MAWLIDTCLWIEVERGRVGPSDIARFTGSDDVFLSPVTISELQFGVEMATDEGIRQARQKSVDALKKKPLLIIDDGTGAIHGRMCASLRKAGKQSDYRIMDLWLAAQAIQHNLSLLTSNIRDFKDIPGLSLLEFQVPESMPSTSGTKAGTSS